MGITYLLNDLVLNLETLRRCLRLQSCPSCHRQYSFIHVDSTTIWPWSLGLPAIQDFTSEGDMRSCFRSWHQGHQRTMGEKNISTRCWSCFLLVRYQLSSIMSSQSSSLMLPVWSWSSCSIFVHSYVRVYEPFSGPRPDAAGYPYPAFIYLGMNPTIG